MIVKDFPTPTPKNFNAGYCKRKSNRLFNLFMKIFKYLNIFKMNI